MKKKDKTRERKKERKKLRSDKNRHYTNSGTSSDGEVVGGRCECHEESEVIFRSQEGEDINDGHDEIIDEVGEICNEVSYNSPVASVPHEDEHDGSETGGLKECHKHRKAFNG